jgi:hypothetical protein
MAEGYAMSNSLEKYVGTYVITKEPIPSDRRGESIPEGTTLLVRRMIGDQHFDLEWLDGKLAANQVHFTKLKTG